MKRLRPNDPNFAPKITKGPGVKVTEEALKRVCKGFFSEPLSPEAEKVVAAHADTLREEIDEQILEDLIVEIGETPCSKF